MRFQPVRALAIAGVVSLLLLAHLNTAVAEDLNTIFAKVNQLVESKSYPKAIAELSWARKEIEKMHQVRLGELIPASVGGFTGGEVQYQAALGFTNIERIYKNGDQEVKFTITGGSGEGMGGLAGLAKMGMMFGAQPGMEQFRIDGITATLNTTGSTPEATIFLDSGSIVTLNAQNGVDAAALKKFAEGFKFSELDNYLKG